MPPTSSPSRPLGRPSGAPWPLDEAAAFLSISERHLYRLVDAGKVKTIELGRRRLVPDAEVVRLATEGA